MTVPGTNLTKNNVVTLTHPVLMLKLNAAFAKNKKYHNLAKMIFPPRTLMEIIVLIMI